MRDRRDNYRSRNGMMGVLAEAEMAPNTGEVPEDFYPPLGEDQYHERRRDGPENIYEDDYDDVGSMLGGVIDRGPSSVRGIMDYDPRSAVRDEEFGDSPRYYPEVGGIDPESAVRDSEFENEQDAMGNRRNQDTDYEEAARMLPEGLGPENNPYAQQMDPGSVGRTEEEEIEFRRSMRRQNQGSAAREAEYRRARDQWGATREREQEGAAGLMGSLKGSYNLGRRY